MSVSPGPLPVPLSHDPGPTWPCYSPEGDEGAGRSNLYLGVSGAEAIIGYVDDAGVDSLGHRRWVLDPRAGVFGTGSTGTTNALLVIGTPASQPAVPELVAWPPPGPVPWQLVFGTWSGAISGSGTVDVSNASVAVALDGQPRSVSGVMPLQDGYGTGRTLSWSVGGIAESDRQAGHTISVTISNVLVDGNARTFSYTIDAFPVLPPDAAPFTASRSTTEVQVEWDAPTERGAPVTGYRVLGNDGRSAPAFDESLGAGARELTVPYVQPGRTVMVSVIPLSRAGSPWVSPLTLEAPTPTPTPTASATATPTGTASVTPTPGPTGTPTPGFPWDPTDDPFGSPPARAPAGLAVAEPQIRGTTRLIVRASISQLANGDRLHLILRIGRRVFRHSRLIRSGRARFNVRLPAAFWRRRHMSVVVRYPGGYRVRADSERWRY